MKQKGYIYCASKYFIFLRHISLIMLLNTSTLLPGHSLNGNLRLKKSFDNRLITKASSTCNSAYHGVSTSASRWWSEQTTDANWLFLISLTQWLPSGIIRNLTSLPTFSSSTAGNWVIHRSQGLYLSYISRMFLRLSPVSGLRGES